MTRQGGQGGIPCLDRKAEPPEGLGIGEMDRGEVGKLPQVVPSEPEGATDHLLGDLMISGPE
jgi:hypothetical protein